VCLHEGTCAVRDPVHVINGVVRDALATVSLSDLIDPAFSAQAELSAPLQILGRTDAPSGAATE